MRAFDFLQFFDYFAWAGAVVAIGVCIVIAIVSARINLPILGALTAIPVAVGLLISALGLQWWPPHPALASILAVELFALGVVAGGPLTLFIVGLAESHSVRAGVHGGIVPATATELARMNQAEGRAEGREMGRDEDRQSGREEGREVLRGGATIGYLERIAVLGCLAVGRFEGIAVIVAIKGLGRFGELDSPEARERFIIGTLVSLIWACATGALLLLTLRLQF